jgi:hypothetical protein
MRTRPANETVGWLNSEGPLNKSPLPQSLNCVVTFYPCGCYAVGIDAAPNECANHPPLATRKEVVEERLARARARRDAATDEDAE